MYFSEDFVITLKCRWSIRNSFNIVDAYFISVCTVNIEHGIEVIFKLLPLVLKILHDDGEYCTPSSKPGKQSTDWGKCSLKILFSKNVDEACKSKVEEMSAKEPDEKEEEDKEYENIKAKESLHGS